MHSRWIIRGFFLGLLLLCVGGWAWSAAHEAKVAHVRNGWFVACGTGGGAVYAARGEDGLAIFGKRDGWYTAARATPGHAWLEPDFLGHLPQRTGNVDFAGFQYITYTPNMDFLGGWYWQITVPYWFLILLFSGLLYFVWRKPRPKTLRAFPVAVRG